MEVEVDLQNHPGRVMEHGGKDAEGKVRFIWHIYYYIKDIKSGRKYTEILVVVTDSWDDTLLHFIYIVMFLCMILIFLYFVLLS